MFSIQMKLETWKRISKIQYVVDVAEMYEFIRFSCNLYIHFVFFSQFDMKKWFWFVFVQFRRFYLFEVSLQKKIQFHFSLCIKKWRYEFRVLKRFNFKSSSRRRVTCSFHISIFLNIWMNENGMKWKMKETKSITSTPWFNRLDLNKWGSALLYPLYRMALGWRYFPFQNFKAIIYI